MSRIREMVENPHYIYQRNFAYWNFLLESYEGGMDYTQALVKASQGASGGLKDFLFKIFASGKEVKAVTESNLFMHPKERAEDYKDRVRMSYYYNFCSPIIDIYTDHLFKQPIMETWDGIEKLIEQRKENIDKKGASISEFRKEMADLAQIYGHVFVMSDSPQVGRAIRSLKDKQDNDAFAYLTLQHPQNILNWSLDKFGQPYWVLVREIGDANQDAMQFDKDAKSKTNYRLWTRTDWFLYNAGYEQIDTGSHGLGIVPITAVFDKQSKKVRNFLGISSIADIVFIARDIYNSCSELKQILRDQTFAFLAIQGSSDEYSELSVGTNKGLLYPEGRNAPQYVSPPFQNAEVYFKHVDRQISKIFQLAKLEGGSAAQKSQEAVQQSGVSKAWDFNQTNSALSKKASNLEDGEMKIWQTIAKWEGGEFNGSITYPNEFSIQSLIEDLDEAERLMKLSLGKSFNLEIKKAIVKKKFPRMPEKEIDKFTKEIEANEGKTEGGKLMDRIPSLKRNATLGGQKKENGNV